MSAPLQAEDVAYCHDFLRSNANDFYLANLLLPAQWRHDIAVLYAFHIEVTNIAWAVHEPLAGEVRLQWWADVVEGLRKEEALAHPIARSLLSVMAHHQLPVQSLQNKISAHIFDLYNDPMGERIMLEGYCGETRSSLFQMAALIAGAEQTSVLADASGHGGVASALTGMVENLSWHRNKGQVYWPQEILQSVGLTPAHFLEVPSEAHQLAVVAMIDLAQEHWLKAVTAVKKLPTEHQSLFTPLALVSLYLKRMQKTPDKAFEGYGKLPQLKRQWALWRKPW